MSDPKKVFILSLFIILILVAGTILKGIAQGAQRTPTGTTIPTAMITSKGVLLECNPSLLLPGSINTGTVGFLRVKCSTGGYVQLGINGNVSLTPTFVLSPGYVNASIILSNSAGHFPCDDRFQTLMSGNVTFPSGSLLTSGSPISFASPAQQGFMEAGLYDYCLSYDASQAVGSTIAGFSITWT